MAARAVTQRTQAKEQGVLRESVQEVHQGIQSQEVAGYQRGAPTQGGLKVIVSDQPGLLVLGVPDYKSITFVVRHLTLAPS